METIFVAVMLMVLVPLTIQTLVTSRQQRYVMFLEEEAAPRTPALGCLPILAVGALAIVLLTIFG